MSPDRSCIFVSTSAGELHALCAQTGRNRWSHIVDQLIFKFFLYGPDGANFYLASVDRLQAFETFPGKFIWTREMHSDPKIGFLSPDGGSLFLRTDSGEML